MYQWRMQHCWRGTQFAHFLLKPPMCTCTYSSATGSRDCLDIPPFTTLFLQQKLYQSGHTELYQSRRTEHTLSLTLPIMLTLACFFVKRFCREKCTNLSGLLLEERSLGLGVGGIVVMGGAACRSVILPRRHWECPPETPTVHNAVTTMWGEVYRRFNNESGTISGGSRIPPVFLSLRQKPIILQDFDKNCMKIKEIGPRCKCPFGSANDNRIWFPILDLLTPKTHHFIFIKLDCTECQIEPIDTLYQIGQFQKLYYVSI